LLVTMCGIKSKVLGNHFPPLRAGLQMIFGDWPPQFSLTQQIKDASARRGQIFVARHFLRHRFQRAT
jgi:hypothetical protein